jgi:hypothetical protein
MSSGENINSPKESVFPIEHLADVVLVSLWRELHLVLPRSPLIAVIFDSPN